MMTKTERELFRKCVNKFGFVNQLLMWVEESSELNKELVKGQRGFDNRLAVVEEIADAQIMLDQLKVMFDCEMDVLVFRAKKIRKLQELTSQGGS